MALPRHDAYTIEFTITKRNPMADDLGDLELARGGLDDPATSEVDYDDYQSVSSADIGDPDELVQDIALK